MDDSFLPVCQDDGSYAPVQCFQHEGFGKQCWCVDEKGEEIGDTRTTDGSTPTCEKGSTTNSLKYHSPHPKLLVLSWPNLRPFPNKQLLPLPLYDVIGDVAIPSGRPTHSLDPIVFPILRLFLLHHHHHHLTSLDFIDLIALLIKREKQIHNLG